MEETKNGLRRMTWNHHIPRDRRKAKEFENSMFVYVSVREKRPKIKLIFCYKISLYQLITKQSYYSPHKIFFCLFHIDNWDFFPFMLLVFLNERRELKWWNKTLPVSKWLKRINVQNGRLGKKWRDKETAFKIR